MSSTQVASQTQRIVVNSSSRSISLINAGPQGPAGIPGPSEASLILVSDGQLLTRVDGELAPITRLALAEDAAFKTVINHGATSAITRTTSQPILWIGSVDPINAVNDDRLYRTDQTALYFRVSGSWVEVGSSRYSKSTLGSGNPFGTGSNGEWYYDISSDRLFMSDGVGWIVMYEPVQTVTATTTNISTGTNGSVKHYYQRRGGRCACNTEIAFGTSGTKLTLTSGHTIVLPKTPKRLMSFSAIFYHGGLGSGFFYVNGANSQFAYLSSLSAQAIAISDTTPWTWALNDSVQAHYEYEMNTPYL